MIVGADGVIRLRLRRNIQRIAFSEERECLQQWMNAAAEKGATTVDLVEYLDMRERFLADEKDADA